MNCSSMSEVHELVYESEGRRPKASEDGGHTIGLRGDGRTTSAIILAEAIEKSRRTDPSEGFVLLSSEMTGVLERV